MKKTLSVVLSLILIATIMPLNYTTVAATSLDSRVEAAIQWAISIANDNSHGYSQANRNGPDYDCSSFVSTAFKNGGFSVSGSLNTSSMKAAFEKVGFTAYKKGDVTIQRGDILLKPGSHVELYLGNDTCVAAHNDYDGKTGDGNGKEIQVRTKSYCTFCKQANYTYVLRYYGTTSTTHSYSFNFNANGGTLGSSGAFTTSYGHDFQILNTTCTRSGYTWAGWNVKRNTDNKWYVAGKGWCTDSEISANGYSKKVYSNYQTCTLDDSWINGISGNGSYTFYAIWIQSRVDTLKVFLSPYGEGCDHTTALNNRTSTGYTQDKIYAWYILYDGNTGDLMNTYSNKTYSVELAVHDPNGNLVFNYTYSDSSDANWIGVTPQMSGTYTATATISGAYSGSISTTYNVSYDAELISSYGSVSLNLNGNNTSTITFTPTNGYPGNMGVSYNYDHSIIEKVSGSWSNNVFSLTVKGLKYGSTNIVMNLYENYTGNKNVVATVTVPVTVTANTYTVSYDANGGSGAPSSQTKYYGTDIVLSSTIPTRSGYTFLGWSTNSSATSATYQPGSTYTSNTSATLYAVWKANTYTITYNANGGTGAPSAQTKNAGETITLTSQIPTKTGYNFLAWCDNSEVTGENYIECITGTREGSIFLSGEYYSTDKNITLYAVWEKQSYLISYNANGGSGAPPSQTKYYGTNTALSLTVPTRTGYTFIGWATSSYATSAAYEPGETYTGNSSITLYAVWEAKGYSVLFDANGGSGEPAQQIKIHDQPLTLSSTKPTRSGYTFLGWSTSNSATSAMYQPGGSYTVNSATRLFAVWKEDVVLSSVSVYSKPIKTAYYIGDSFNAVGLQIKLIYSDGSYEIISSGFTTSGFGSENAGTKTITVSYGGKTTTFSVMVKSPTITLSSSSKTMNVAETSTITATTTPSGQSVIWTSSDTSIATVSNGIITAKAAGTATITAKITYNGIVYLDTCTVTVKENISIGDVNGDGIVDAGDAVIISRYDAGLVILTADQLKAGDVNGDGMVDAGDAVIISRYDAGLISTIK